MKGRAHHLCGFALATFVTALCVLAVTARVRASEEFNFAGSAQFDYYYALRSYADAVPAPGPRTAFTGFTTEAALKVAADISDHLSANFKLCYGCHGFEVNMAYFDYRVSDEFNVRAGRFSPTFGAFNLRHDPANHALSDKPLPYDMGRMLRRGDWNNSVLPSPFPTTALELDGIHWIGTSVELDYAAYLAMGFKNDVDAHPTDIDFQESHLPYYVNMNPRPTVGAHLAVTLKLSALTDLSTGVSGMYGTYDPNHHLTYAIIGADWSLRIARTTLRAEYLARRQQMDVANPGIFKYALGVHNGDYFIKHGAYLELEVPIDEPLTLLARVDGMAHQGNVSEVPVGTGGDIVVDTALTNNARVLRETFGLAYAIDHNLRIKSSIETWQFSYPDENNHKSDISSHLGLVGSF